MEPGPSAGQSDQQRPTERQLLQRLLSHCRENSATGDALQLLTQQLLLQSVSRSLSTTQAWEVDRLSSSLRPQQTVINQPLEHAKPPSGDLLGASWHDIQRVRADACIEARQQELAAEAEQLPEAERLGALIEAKKLKLVALQREMRQEILAEQRLVESCSDPTQLLDWSRWKRPPANRLSSFVPPKLPAVEVQRRLQRDPETARRARQHALQQWATQAQQGFVSQPSWQSAAAQRWDSMGVLSSGALQQTQSWPRLRPQPTLEAQLLEGIRRLAATAGDRGGAPAHSPGDGPPLRKRARSSSLQPEGQAQQGGDAGGPSSRDPSPAAPRAEAAPPAADAAVPMDADADLEAPTQQQQPDAAGQKGDVALANGAAMAGKLSGARQRTASPAVGREQPSWAQPEPGTGEAAMGPEGPEQQGGAPLGEEGAEEMEVGQGAGGGPQPADPPAAEPEQEREGAPQQGQGDDTEMAEPAAGEAGAEPEERAGSQGMQPSSPGGGSPPPAGEDMAAVAAAGPEEGGASEGAPQQSEDS